MRGCRTARRRLLLQGRVHRGLPRDRTGLTPRGQSLGPVPDDAPMRVPMVGACGFIGSRIVGGVLLRRRFATCELIACDLAHYDADSWHNVDGLINAAVDCAEPWTLCTRPCAGSCRNTSTSRRRRRRNTSPDQKTGINIGFGRRMGVRTAAMPTSGEQAEGLEGMEFPEAASQPRRCGAAGTGTGAEHRTVPRNSAGERSQTALNGKER